MPITYTDSFCGHTQDSSPLAKMVAIHTHLRASELGVFRHLTFPLAAREFSVLASIA